MVTSLQDLKRYAGGSEVELPGFLSEEPLIVKLRRPSLLHLAESGGIPNPLLATAAELFKNGTSGVMKDNESLIEMAKVMRCIAKAALVEPTYQEFEDAKINLTDTQLMYIYNYVQTGIDSLRMFRKEQGIVKNHKSGDISKQKSESDYENKR
ncbi:hypothetical protein [Diplocloster hominis]|uniref:hypothetical protein n=1 Tax=Diplocloster hominis TaxID=3079010 RepID=UPI0031BB6E9F